MWPHSLCVWLCWSPHHVFSRHTHTQSNKTCLQNDDVITTGIQGCRVWRADFNSEEFSHTQTDTHRQTHTAVWPHWPAGLGPSFTLCHVYLTLRSFRGKCARCAQCVGGFSICSMETDRHTHTERRIWDLALTPPSLSDIFVDIFFVCFVIFFVIIHFRISQEEGVWFGRTGLHPCVCVCPEEERMKDYKHLLDLTE